jgi:hypothetical protein
VEFLELEKVHWSIPLTPKNKVEHLVKLVVLDFQTRQHVDLGLAKDESLVVADLGLALE